MNKKELLSDLKAKSFVDSLNGEPKPQETKVDGGKWYIQNIREIKNGNAAVYRNISFYVINEGTKNEVAYYKDDIPVSILSGKNDYEDKINKLIATLDNIEIERINTDKQFAVLKKYIQEAGYVKEVRMLVDKDLKMTEIK